MSDRDESSSMSESAARVLSGKSWEDFCDGLKNAGKEILRDSSPEDAFDRAEGLRYLTRLCRAAFETFIEGGDPRAPELRRVAHETVKMGADNPDNYYLSAPISGKYEYRITGTRGTVHYLGLGTQAGNYGETGSLETTGYLDASDLEIGEDGDIEIAVSVRPQEGNWLPMREDSRLVVIRQTFGDRSREEPATLVIRRSDGPHQARALTPERIDHGLVGSALFVAGSANFFNKWTEGFLQHVNELPLFDRDVATAAGGIPDVDYYHSYWRLDPDEALVIDVTPPVCDYWNFQLNNHWMESLDYRYHRIVINHCDAVTGPDGSVRIVVAHRDPGHPNWLETAGHLRGTMCLRWIRAETKPTPRTRVVRFDELASLG
jgi:hypothetical protein